MSIDFVLERDGFNLPSDDTRARAINDLIDLGMVKRGEVVFMLSDSHLIRSNVVPRSDQSIDCKNV